VTGAPVSLEKANRRKRRDAKQPAYGASPYGISQGGGVTERRNDMAHAFQTVVFGAWDFWSGLFGPLPYGDPYIAIFTLVVLAAMAVKMLAGGEPA